MSNVHELGLEKKFPINGELYDDIVNVISNEKYEGQISLVELIGVLELIKYNILEEQY